MGEKIIELTQDNLWLSVSRGFLVIDREREELARVPLDDIFSVIGNAYGLSFTNNVLTALAERRIPFIVLGKNHAPIALMQPIEGNYEQSRRMNAQVIASKPLKKRLWADIIRIKIKKQSEVLKKLQRRYVLLERLGTKVKSGDPENIEAQAARFYWKELFGNQFRRDRNADGVNSFLNYGYTILRSAVSRFICANGLHSSIGIHHSNASNAFCLSDDLMEVFRPDVDLNVYQLTRGEENIMTPEIKKTLAELLHRDVFSSSASLTLNLQIQQFIYSFVECLMNNKKKLVLPNKDAIR